MSPIYVQFAIYLSFGSISNSRYEMSNVYRIFVRGANFRQIWRIWIPTTYHKSISTVSGCFDFNHNMTIMHRLGLLHFLHCSISSRSNQHLRRHQFDWHFQPKYDHYAPLGVIELSTLFDEFWIKPAFKTPSILLALPTSI